MIEPNASKLPEGFHFVEVFPETSDSEAFVFDEGHALEMLHALRSDGWDHWPVKTFCEHCGSWLTSMEANGDFTGFFCSCIGIWSKDPQIPTQQLWYEIRGRALKLWHEEQAQFEEESWRKP